MGQTKIQKIDRELPVKLTEKEKLEYGDTLAHMLTDIEQRKAKRSKMTKKINEIAAEAKTYKDAIETGEEPRIVKCEIRFNYAKNKKVTVRLDTNEVVDEEAMTAEERQTELPA